MIRKLLTFIALSSLLCTHLWAQVEEMKWKRVDRDSIPAGLDSLLVDQINSQPTDDEYRVVTNRFWNNWFVYGDFGYHTFRGDWSGNGKFKETLNLYAICSRK